MSHTGTQACMDLGEGAPWKEAPGVLSSTPSLKPQSFPHFPQCCVSPSPLHLGERKLHNPLGAANVAKDYSQRRGKLQPEASSSPQAGWLQPPQPQVLVLDRAFLSHQLSLEHPERDTEGQWPTQTSQRIPKFSCTFPASPSRNETQMSSGSGQMGAKALSLVGKPFLCTGDF